MAYRSISTTTWQDPWFESITPKAKLAFLYLWTNDVCNQAGFYRVSEKRINFEIGFKFAEVVEELKPKINWYPDESIIWVKAFFKRQCGNEKFMVGAFNCLCEFQENHISNWFAYNKEHILIRCPKLEDIPERYRLQSILIPYVMGIDTLCLSDTDTDTDTDTDKNSLAQKSTNANNGFEHFWNKYPKKKSKGRAQDAWTKLLKSKKHPGMDTIIESLTKLIPSHEWTKDNGEFIPYPASWLNAKGWMDEVTPQANREFLKSGGKELEWN